MNQKWTTVDDGTHKGPILRQCEMIHGAFLLCILCVSLYDRARVLSELSA